MAVKVAAIYLSTVCSTIELLILKFTDFVQSSLRVRSHGLLVLPDTPIIFCVQVIIFENNFPHNFSITSRYSQVIILFVVRGEMAEIYLSWKVFQSPSMMVQ